MKTNLSTNLALRKLATSSGKYDRRFHPSKAVDGNRDPTLLNGHCFQSSPQTNAWWQVDLQGVYFIKEVVIANRADTCCCKLGVTLVSILFNRYVCVYVCVYKYTVHIYILYIYILYTYTHTYTHICVCVCV